MNPLAGVSLLRHPSAGAAPNLSVCLGTAVAGSRRETGLRASPGQKPPFWQACLWKSLLEGIQCHSAVPQLTHTPPPHSPSVLATKHVYPAGAPSGHAPKVPCVSAPSRLPTSLCAALVYIKQGDLKCLSPSCAATSGVFGNCLCAAQVFEQGSLYSPSALDIKQDDLMSAVQSAIANVAAASLQLNYPTLASIPHSIVNGYKNVLAVSVATEFTFPLAEKVRVPLPHET